VIATSQGSSRRYLFADLVLDTGQRRLWRGDEEVRLSKLSFDFLRALVEAAPNLLAQDQLAEEVWGPRRVVTPENLAQRFIMLRHALGDHAEQPRYIEVVRGQGYRLIPKVETTDASSAPLRSSGSYRRWVAAAASVAMMGIVALGAYRLLGTDEPNGTDIPISQSAQTVQFEVNATGAGQPGSFALSPDGTQLVFLSAADGPRRLWLRPLDKNEAVPLADTDNAEYPFWSPDSKAVAFLADGLLKAVSIETGFVRTLTRTIQAPQGGSWGNEGVLYSPSFTGPVFYLKFADPEHPFATPVTVQEKPLQSGHAFPQWLPDGRHFLYYVRGDPSVAGVWLGDVVSAERYFTRVNQLYREALERLPPDERARLESGQLLDFNLGGEPVPMSTLDSAAEQLARENYLSGPDAPRRLLEADSVAVYVHPGQLLFVKDRVLVAQSLDMASLSPQGEPVPVAEPVSSVFGSPPASASLTRSIAYQTEPANRYRFVRVDRQGAELEQLGAMAEYIRGTFELSRDSRTAALVLADSQGAQGMDIWLFGMERENLIKFTHGAGNEWMPVWSPDGRRIVYASFQGTGTTDLVLKPLNGTDDGELLLRTDRNKRPADWSADGRLLLYYSVEVDGPDIWALPMDPRGEPFPVTENRFAEWRAQFSPDAKWIAYESNESDRVEVWIRSFRGGRQWQVSNGGGSMPRWRRDGRELYYLAPDGQLMAVPLQADEPGEELKVGVPEPLFSLPTSQYSSIENRDGYSYAVAPDGDGFIVVATDDGPLSVTVNWPGAQ
jgi:eukaryotic-like serine/threonine-protein kinase